MDNPKLPQWAYDLLKLIDVDEENKKLESLGR